MRTLKLQFLSSYIYQSEMFMSRLKQGYLNVLVKSLINCESFPRQHRVRVEHFTAGHTQAHTPWQTSTPSHTSLMFCSKYLQTLPGSQIVSWKQDVIYTSFWFHFISHYIEVAQEGKKWWSQFVWWWSSIREKNFKSSLEYTSGQSLISSGLQPQYNHHRLMHKIPNILLTQSTKYVYIQ